MAKGASGVKSRNVFTIANKYQASIIFLTFMPSILMFLLFVCIIFISNPGLSDAVFHATFLGLEKIIFQ